MSDSGAVTHAPEDHDDHETPPADYSGRIRWAVWLLVSVSFVGYLLVAPIEIRLWQSGRMTFVDRDITHVWSYFGDRLPEMPYPTLTSVLFWLSVGAMILTTLIGLWYFLVANNDDTRDDVPAGPSVATHHD